MPAHNLLWRECEKSSDNVAARLAVIPLVQVPFFIALNVTLRFRLSSTWLVPFDEKLLTKVDRAAVLSAIKFLRQEDWKKLV